MITEIIDSEIARWQQEPDPYADGAVSILKYLRGTEFTIKDLEERYNHYHKRNWPDMDKGVTKFNLLQINQNRRRYKRKALRDLGKLIKEALTMEITDDKPKQ